MKTAQTPDLTLALRKAHSAENVAAFKAWAEQQLTRLPGKNDLAKAFRYALRRWPSFTLFLEDGRVAIDSEEGQELIRGINSLTNGPNAPCARSAWAAKTGSSPDRTPAAKPSPAP